MKKGPLKQVITVLVVCGFGLTLIGATVLHLGAGLFWLGIITFVCAGRVMDHHWAQFWIHENPLDKASLQILRCDDETPRPSGKYWYKARVFIGPPEK